MKRAKKTATGTVTWIKSEMSSKDRCFVVESRDGVVIGDVAELHYQSSRPKEVQLANARLMAASKELLAVAQAVIDWNNDDCGDGHGLDRILTLARVAKAKASGTEDAEASQAHARDIRLAAAADDLLAACKLAVKRNVVVGGPTWEVINDAVNKAEGR